MKKTITILTLLFLFSFNLQADPPDEYDIMESINTLEDMIEWMEWDIEIGKVDSAMGYIYIHNMKDCIERLSKEDRWKDYNDH